MDQEQAFYELLDNHISCLSDKKREKYLITQQLYDQILDVVIKVKDINVNMVQSLHTSVRQTSNLKILVPDVFYFARKHHVQLPLWRKLLLLFNAVMTEWATE